MTGTSNSLLKNILCIVAGIVAGVVVIMVVQTIGHQVYPVASDVDYEDQEAMRALVASMPAGALLFVLLSYALGSFVGGGLTARLSPGGHMRHALIVGAVLMVMGLMNLVSIPHPLWFNLGTLLVFLPAAWLGGQLLAGGAAGDSSGQSGS